MKLDGRELVCDFCSSPNVACRYQCMDFDAESKSVGVLYADPAAGPTNVVLASKNYWAACAGCARYVDAEDIDGLLKYVTENLIDASGGLSPFRRLLLIRHLRHMYELFFKYRIRVA